MKQITLIILLAVITISCEDKREISSVSPANWDARAIHNKLNDSLETGRTYLSVYSQIFIQTERRTHDLTATISMRNTSATDTLYLLKAEYFDTKGKPIRNYLNNPVFLSPLETVEIIIDEADKAGGTGANFIFDWKIKKASSEPIFEGIMISTSGQQGLSFSTQGKRIDR